MKIVYMGTPAFAANALEAIIAAGHQVTAVVTQPDKQAGRGGKLQCSAVKECALHHQIPVFQPVKLKNPEEIERLRQYEADIFVVAAFGQILTEEVLHMPRFGCVNIHASLLPRYRGAAPIQWAVINGEAQSGVTIQQMGKGIDTGDILFQEKIELAPKETGESLYEKLGALGAELIVKALPQIEQGAIHPVKQKEEESNYVGQLTKAQGEIDWKQGAVQIERLIRGLNPWPSAYTVYQDKILKLWDAEVLSTEDLQEMGASSPGTILSVDKKSILVQTGEGALRLLEVQLAGKKRMSVRDFLLGNQVKPGEQFQVKD